MSVIDDLEDDTVLVVFLLLIALGVVIYLSVKQIKIPESWYPEPVFDAGATGIDTTLSGMPGWTQPVKSGADRLLGSIGAWIDDNLPRTPSEVQGLQGPQQSGDDGTDAGDYAEADTGTIGEY